ncbi:Bug family tripartite tricarboxylate transporter substrate binding protein [Lacisediminimonas profundi]|uniref:Bug family tripartite tricarboxylate transporter substrate binding protein n=1 Tax=Lacisediminimonas profundi TaxID=2603856 RepID=UPI00124B9044|nr:tripartite tricarboxylate transporter substrate binding protein [Lacisediminimonas profundi]
MKSLKIKTLRVLAGLGIVFFSNISLANNYPTKPVHIIIPFAPGGPTDVLARQLSEELRAKWGHAVVLENKPGANGIIASQHVAKSPADGYTLILATQSSHAANASMYSKLPYNPVSSFEPVSLLATTPLVLLSNPSLPVSSVKELIDHAKKRPGKVNFAGGSSSAQAGGALMNMLAGIEMNHIPYKSNAPALTDLLGGHVQIMFNVLNASARHIEAGNLKALAVTSSSRSAAAPNVPTMIEAGVPGFELVPWFALFAPANTPKDIVAKLSADVSSVLKLPNVRKTLVSQSLDPIGSTPDELKVFQLREIKKWEEIVQRANMKAD